MKSSKRSSGSIMLEYARNILYVERQKLVIITRDGELIKKTGKGIQPLYDVLSGKKKELQGATIADRVVGKGAAMLMLYAGVSEVWAEILSAAALKLFKEYNIPVTFKEMVPYIKNNDATDMCPVEKVAMEVSDPGEAYKKIKSFLHS